MEIEKPRPQRDQQLSSPLPIPQIEFKTAFEEFNNKHLFLTCGIEKLDSILNLTVSDRLAIIGKRIYTQILITRLCINALSKKGHKIGFNTSNVIFVDAGNSTDIYQYVNFARQYGVDTEQILQRIILSRVFTVYQLADMIIHELSNVIQKFDSKIIVISDLLNMFVHDPQIEIKEARYLIKEIVKSIMTTRAFKDVLIIISISDENDINTHYNSSISYSKIILPSFDKYIKIINDDNNNSLINIKTRNSNRSFKYNTNLHSSKLLSIKERDLLMVSAY